MHTEGGKQECVERIGKEAFFGALRWAEARITHLRESRVVLTRQERLILLVVVCVQQIVEIVEEVQLVFARYGLKETGHHFLDELSEEWY